MSFSLLCHACNNTLGQDKVKVQNIRNRQTKAQDGVSEKKEYLMELFSRDRRPGEER